MPAPLDVNREAVRTLVLAVGVREAARRMKIPEATVQAWSARGKWIETHRALVATKPLQPVATKASEALSEAIARDSEATRSGLSRGVRKAAEVIGEFKGETVIKKSEDVRRIVSSAAQIHNWGERGQDQGADLVILSIGGNVNLGSQTVEKV